MPTPQFNRVPAGTPSGGQFAESRHGESASSLSVPPSYQEDMERYQAALEVLDDPSSEVEDVALSPEGAIQFRNRYGQIHRIGGPAIIGSDGTKAYYEHGQLHRADGPAITTPDGEEYYFEHGECRLAAPMTEDLVTEGDEA